MIKTDINEIYLHQETARIITIDIEITTTTETIVQDRETVNIETKTISKKSDMTDHDPVTDTTAGIDTIIDHTVNQWIVLHRAQVVSHSIKVTGTDTTVGTEMIAELIVN